MEEALEKLNALGVGKFGIEEKPAKYYSYQLYKLVDGNKLAISRYLLPQDMAVWLDGYLTALKG